MSEQDHRRAAGDREPARLDRVYDTVLIGSPIWNVRPPMIMTTFAESHDFTGKQVYPFVTHAVSGLGSTEPSTPPPSPVPGSVPVWPSRAKRCPSTAATSRPGCEKPA